ncbi:hypothetical protein [Nocardia bovistercoris]|uniref:Uncharacterized protein n=1 Tax=Nocardia bovistercoris TaxID=2785916 RepID=A0A931I950_9NOCA|nr:hypothetical protein [Nocardia bovistercoris]MBH0776188.1 hypothetical protein [Nocardia bovistercoris]
MSALTRGTMRVTRVKLTPEQIAERRREAEKILGRRLPPRPTQSNVPK